MSYASKKICGRVIAVILAIILVTQTLPANMLQIAAETNEKGTSSEVVLSDETDSSDTTEADSESNEESTEATDGSTEENDESTEATDGSTEEVEESTEATDASTEETEESTEATDASTEESEASSDASEESTEVKEERSEFVFENSKVQIVYQEGATFTYTVKNSYEEENIPVVYTSSNKEIASVDEYGTVTFLQAGTVTITATMAASNNYIESTASYTITALQPRTGFGFTENEFTITYGDNDNSFKNVVDKTEDEAKISYTIISQKRDNKEIPEDDAVATIDSETGEVTILTAGVIEVEAAVEAGEYYAAATDTYTLTINRAEREFSFEEESTSLAYGEELTLTLKGANEDVTYKVTEFKETVSKENEKNEVISVDENGKITAVSIGSATVEATIAKDNCYNVASDTINITVNKAEQTNFAFEEEYIFPYSVENTVQVKASGGNTKGAITYAIESDIEGITEDINAETGAITLVDQKTGTFTVSSTKAGDDFYKDITVKAPVTIEEIPESNNSDKLPYIITGEQNEGYEEWYVDDVTITAQNGYLISESTSKGSFKEGNEISITKEGSTKQKIYWVVQNAKKQIPAWTEVEVCIDKTDPVINVSFEDVNCQGGQKYYYKNRTAYISITETNFVAKNVFSNIKVDGVVSEKYENYLQNEKNWTSNGDIHTITLEFTEDAMYTFDLSCTDLAGRTSSKLIFEEGTADETEFVIDNEDPVISVEYIDGGVHNEKYFSSFIDEAGNTVKGRIAIVTIEEPNFSAEKIESAIKVDGVVSTDYKEYLKNADNWEKDGDKHIIEIPFAEDAVYSFGIKCTDLAGYSQENIKFADGTEAATEFVVDNTLPVIEVAYSNNEVTNDKYFSTVTEIDGNEIVGRTATVTITEHNFQISEAVKSIDSYIKVNDIASDEYAALLKNPENWTSNGDTHTIEIPFVEDAEYNIGIEYTDLAGNAYKVGEKDFVEGTQAAMEFIVDNTIPVIKVKYNNNTVVNEKYFTQITDANGNQIVGRTATVTITERNFSSRDVVSNIKASRYDDQSKIIKYDKYLQDEKNWTSDGDYHTIEIPFVEDATYEFDIEFMDLAGHSGEEEFAAGTQLDTEFIVDNTKPEINISYDNNAVANDKYFKDTRKATITIKDYNFDASRVAVDIGVSNNVEDVNVQEKYVNYLQNHKNWTTTDNVTYTAEIPFDTQAFYTVKLLECTDLANNVQNDVMYDEDTEKAPFDFVVDTTAPTDLEITINEELLNEENEVVFEKFYDGQVVVKLSANCDISGLNSLKYQKVDAADKYNESGTWTDYNAETGIIIKPSDKFIIYFRAEDNAGRSMIVKSVGVVVDDKAPEITIEPEEANDQTFYKSDVNVDIAVIDPAYLGAEKSTEGYYSGLNKITYEITAKDSDKKVTGTLLDVENGILSGAVTDEDGLTASWDGSIIIDKEFNSNHIILKVVAVDNAGNEYVFETKDEDIKIDIDIPEISIAYDNNDVRNGKYFSTTTDDNGKQISGRNATITIKERNFDASRVGIDIGVSNNVEDVNVQEKYVNYLQNHENWTTTDNVTYTAEIPFDTQAFYTVKLECTDLADNVQNDIMYDEDTEKAPFEFVVDTTAPTKLEIAIGSKSLVDEDEIVYDTFYNEAQTIKLSADCDISGLNSLQYKIVTPANKKDEVDWLNYNAATGILVEPNTQFVLYMKVIDNAGNESRANSTGIIIDDHHPVGENDAPEIDIHPEGVGRIHNSDVRVAINIYDPKFLGEEEGENDNGYFSGLNKITYTIYADDINKSKTVTVLDLTPGEGETVTKPDKENKDFEYSDDGLIYSWTDTITVDANTFNSNNVIVEVTAIDNAGNVKTSKTAMGAIKIDVTAPTISIFYDNNNADDEVYFKDDRKAVITITERNFDSNDVKISITNSDGVIPSVSHWSESGGTSGNGDGTKWTAVIDYTADGDYGFGITFTDNAGNACKGVNYESGTVAPTIFTIDKTAPQIEVRYDNNSVQNGNYYKEERTATVVVKEHNFRADRVNITMTATDDGVATSVPTVNGWTSNGDENYATIRYTDDARYTFDITVTDRAGNDSPDFTEQTFYVDKTVPTLSITGVENNSANSGEVIPVVTYSDTNFDANNVSITLVGANRGHIALEGGYSNIHNGRVFTFNDFAEEKDVDDIYTLTATLTDLAGNTSTETISFSVNRFGSTYVIDENTSKINGTYIKEPQDVVINEVNANELKNIKITLFKNNETIVLKEGVDYKIDIEGGNGEWYQYTYTIFKKNFEDDGVYRVSVYSEDAAGNVAENTLDTKTTEIGFGVDKTNPNIIVENLESGMTYAVESMIAQMSISDNLLLDSVVVYLDDYNTPYKSWDAEEIAEIIAGDGEFSFDISGDSTSAHNVKIVCTDAAGNEQVEEITDFFVTTNLLVRYVNNKPVFYGSTGGMGLLIGLTLFMILFKKKGNEEEAE